MSHEKIFPGEQIYLQAMFKGGGEHSKQARELLNLSNRDFFSAIIYVSNLSASPERFSYLANIINQTHAFVRKNKINFRAPITVDPKMVKEDMDQTLEKTLIAPSNIVRKSLVLYALIRLKRIPKFR